MKTTKRFISFHSFSKDITDLYKDESLTTLFNDLVAIGTWPTPEFPKSKLRRKADGTLAIDSVPLPEKPNYIKALVTEFLEVAGKQKVKDL